MDLKPPAFDSRRRARALFWLGWRVTDIADELGLKRPTVEAWKQRDKWDEDPVIKRIETVTEVRYCQLILKDQKTGADYKEIDLLGRQIERLARVRRYQEPGGHEGDLNQNVADRAAKPKKKPVRNHFDEEQLEQLKANFEAKCFGYQKRWRAAMGERTRAILKSRQIGATFYFAFEALVDAAETGHNQIFLSASKAQAHIFRAYMVLFAGEVGVKLTGDPIILSNGAELHFLGTNARTAQGYHGNFYFDEFFWVYGFDVLKKVASGMAAQKKYRRTFFSTPSSVAHEAYKFWSGEEYNKGRAKADRVEIDISHRALQGGKRCADAVWRDIVTIHDAEAEGCDLFDIAELQRDNSVEDFANLYECQFTDDAESQFPLVMMQGCMVDSWLVWRDFKPLTPRPYAGEVWIGYDPQESEKGDDAALVAIAPPRAPGGPFRLLERERMKGKDFQEQADAIRRMRDRYPGTSYIGIDKKGVGAAVFQLVRQWFPTVVGLEYSVIVKTRLVLHAQALIRRRRFQYDAGWHDVTQSFMAIRKVMTGSGDQVTYKAKRSAGIGHADVAWAIMNALDREPIEGTEAATSRSIMEIS
jgi:uncharacterized protein YjcR